MVFGPETGMGRICAIRDAPVRKRLVLEWMRASLKEPVVPEEHARGASQRASG